MALRFAWLALVLGCSGRALAQQTPLYQELYRPQFHFTAQTNWLNDPNGLVYFNGTYHLFFQHNPSGTGWGNMTWGHAVSADLLHWQQLANAIYPDTNGTIFSGSAVIDTNNTAGFGANALVCLFTYAGSTYRQGLAYSTDGGQTFTKYPAPVIGQYASGNRDPRAFWYAPASQWRLALYLSGNDFAIFGSPDLKAWTQLSTLTFAGGAECPDMYEIALDGNSASNRWIFSQANGKYMVGTFDGTAFTPQTGVLQYEYGANSYAGQTYNNEPSGRRVSLTWMSGASYPGMPFNQQMSIPKEITLRTTASGSRLFAMPVSEVASLRQDGHHWSNQTLSPGDNPLAGLYGRLFDIDLQVALGSATGIDLTLGGNTIHYNASTHQLSALGRTATVDPVSGQLTLRVLLDVTTLEIFAGDGAVAMSSCFVASTDSQALSLSATGAAVTLTHLDVYGLSSAWFPSPGVRYWDRNGVTPGAGGLAPAGTWGSDSAWSTNAVGTSATAAWSQNAIASFAAGSDATGSYTVSVTGNQQVAGLEFRAGTVALSGGAIDLIADNAAVIATNGTHTIQSLIQGWGNLVKGGAGMLILSNANTYAGATVVNGGTLQLAGTRVLAGTQAYYTFNSATNLGLDSSGNGNTLVTATGAPVYSGSGKFNGALYLDGNSTMTTAGFPAGVPTNSSPYTIAAWIKPDTGCSLKGGWVGWGNGANSQANNIRLGGAANSVWAYWWNNDFGGTMPSGTFFDGNYHSVVVTWNGAVEIITIDGANVAQRTPSTVPNVGAANFVVGKTIGDANFKGWLDDLLIANRALSPSEITNLMNGTFSNSIASVLPPNSVQQIASGATLDLNGVSQQVGSLSDSGGAGGSVINGNTGAVSVLTLSPGGGTATFSGLIRGGGTLGTISLVKNGAGTQIHSGSNTYAGGTVINSGTLAANSATALGANTGSLAVNSGGTLQLNTNITQGAVNIAGGIVSGAGAANTLTASNFTSSGGTVFVSLAGPGGLTHASGTLSLYGSNTYAGATVIKGGKLQLAGIPAGTQAYYTFDNPANLGQDISGNGNTLVTATGAPSYAASGKFGGALYLDGNSTLVTASGQFPTGVPTNNSPYSIAVWIKPDTGCSLNGGWVGWGNRADSQANNVRLGGANNNVWAYWWNNDFGGTMPSGNFFDGNYHSVVATWDGTTESITIDGVSVGQRNPATAPAVGAANFVVGKTINDANFKGWVDGLLIANRALSPAEITSFQTFAGNCALPAGTALRVVAGAVMDLNGNSQSVASLSGSGMVTGGTLTVTGRLTPGDTNTVTGALTVQSGLVLSANVTNAFDCTSVTSDVVNVAGTLTLQGRSTVQVSLAGARPPSQWITLFTFGTIIGATNLTNWSVSGCPNGYNAKLAVRASGIVLSFSPTGTLMVEK